MIRERSFGALALWAAFEAIASGCSGDARICDPGVTQRCVCPVGEGAQSCNAEGTAWGACSCGETDAGMPIDASALDAMVSTDAGPSIDANVDAMASCADLATAATVQDVNMGVVGEATSVRLTGVVAMSRPFLVSMSRTTGTCLWGAFVSAPGLTETAPYTGLLVTSYGTMASIPPGGSMAYCPVLGRDPTGSLIPDDLAPGEVLDVVGDVRSFVSSSCGTNPSDTDVPQRQIATPCLIERTGTAAVPTAAVMSEAQVAGLANQTDATFHGQWAGVLVRVEGVTASPPSMPSGSCVTGTSIVNTFGTITLDGSGLAIGDRAYYIGALASTDVCHAAPRYCTTSSFSFTSIEGFHYLDFCTWGLQPADRCGDLVPPSSDCGATSCAP